MLILRHLTDPVWMWSRVFCRLELAEPLRESILLVTASAMLKLRFLTRLSSGLSCCILGICVGTLSADHILRGFVYSSLFPILSVLPCI
jgi:hypothetical protein